MRHLHLRHDCLVAHSSGHVPPEKTYLGWLRHSCGYPAYLLAASAWSLIRRPDGGGVQRADRMTADRAVLSRSDFVTVAVAFKPRANAASRFVA